jgi:hypothetical protein
MKRSLITSILIPIGILLFTACETNQSMMDGYGTHSWEWAGECGLYQFLSL